MSIHFFQTQIGANKDAFGVGTNLSTQRNRIRGFLFVEDNYGRKNGTVKNTYL
jgi:nicotinic acid phosphoribosyltransferase